MGLLDGLLEGVGTFLGVPGVGSVIGGLIGAEGQRDANATNIQLGREQMAFQREMRETSYQAAVKDMKAAGLNPMLAYSQGGASAPVGSMPRVENAMAPAVASAASAASIMQALQQVKQSEAQTQLIKNEATKVASETYDLDLNTALRIFDKDRAEEEVKRIIADRRNKEAENVGIHASSASAEALLREMSKDNGGGWAADVRRRKAEAMLAELDIPRSKGEAKFYEKMEDLPAAVKMIMMILNGSRGYMRPQSR